MRASGWVSRRERAEGGQWWIGSEVVVVVGLLMAVEDEDG